MYNHGQIEQKWQEFWSKNKTFKTDTVSSKPKYYVLDMFPYPSGEGLHVGHPEGYTANDIIARYMHAKGYNVLHPMGWDAFGLPAENFAIKEKKHPSIFTQKNIATFKRQIQFLGFSYDWDREIDTTDPSYFKWTQWIFLKLFEHGLAYEQDLPINYCPSCKTGLANEEVVQGRCERCDSVVEKRKIRQWVLAITKYAERLATDVERLDWPKGIKDMQINWIGKSEGCEFDMQVVDASGKKLGKIGVYTTRVDTAYSMAFAVIAPDHSDTSVFIAPNCKNDCEKYIEDSKNKADQERTQEGKEKTGVFTGNYVINPFNDEKLPLWIGDFVLGSYGTGAVFGDAHDERDFEFAKKYNLSLKVSVIPKNATEEEKEELLSFAKCFVDDGVLINSGEFTGLESAEARKVLTAHAEKKGFGKKKVNYKLRDWLFSRQRYWGEPIPLIHLKKEDVDALSKTSSKNAWIDTRKDGEYLMIGEKEYSKIYDGIYTKIVCDYNLPLNLPEVAKYEPSGDGNSPLASVPTFVNVELSSNLSGKRETNTMPQWGGSCWYYLRFMDPQNNSELVSKEAEKYWGSVDSYVGGAEHAVLHLLYARFWHKFLFDIKVLSTDEPFYRLRNQGMILGMSYKDKKGKLIASDLVEEKDGKYFSKESGEELSQMPAKMSKSLKNVVNPDDVVHEYGADTLRLYEMYMADFKDTKPWDTKAIIGVRRFLDKIWRLFGMDKNEDASVPTLPIVLAKDDVEAMKILHKTIKKVGEDIENYRFNTAIAQMMICVNYGLPKDEKVALEWKQKFLTILHPFAPHIAEELWLSIGNAETIFAAPWPEYDKSLVVDDTITIGVQINGKVRGDITLTLDESKESALTKARNEENILKWLEGKEIVKEVYIPGKILNIVVK